MNGSDNNLEFEMTATIVQQNEFDYAKMLNSLKEHLSEIEEMVRDTPTSQSASTGSDKELRLQVLKHETRIDRLLRTLKERDDEIEHLKSQLK